MIKEFDDFKNGLKPSRELIELQHRRAFGLALLACASFVLTMSFVLPAIDRHWWISGGMAILVAGGYQFDSATRILKKTRR